MARVVGAKGLAGAIRVELVTDWPERVEVGSELFVEDDDRPRKVLSAEVGGRQPVLTLEGIDDRTSAEAISGRYLEAIPRRLPRGSYYWHQLVGLRVTDEAGHELGRLVEVFRAGGGEVYRVEGAAGELLVPALRRVVRRIDLKGGLMVIDAGAAFPEEP